MTCRVETQTADRTESTAGAAPPTCRRFFTIEQAADRADVAIREVRRWITAGKLEAYYLEGGRIRIDEFELAEFLSSPESRP